MKTFLKVFFASCLGLFLSMFLFIIVLSISVGTLVSSSTKSKDTKIESNSILHLNLEGEITDRTYEAPFLNISFSSASRKTTGIFDIQKALKHAKENKNIKILLINIDNASFGIASLYQFINLIEEFKQSQKPVYLYSNHATQKTFLVGAYADKMYMNPMASCEFDGFVLENMFFTGLLEKIGVQPKIVYAGEFKSATEPFRLKENSPENELQLAALLEDIQSEYLSKLSAKLAISKESLNSFANELKITNASDAKKLGLIDNVKYDDELFDELREKMGYSKNEKLSIITYEKYRKTLPDKEYTNTNNQIAVLFAEGEIIDGKGEDGVIAKENYLKYLEDIKEKIDKNEIKALVLRVNSGGGSAFASEQIWRSLSIIKQSIPVVVSFGDVAASGGYYIACSSNKIFAQQSTITGSIGVFGMFFNIQKLLNNKLGITTDEVKTNPYADFGNSTREWTELEKITMQREVDAIYTLFKKRVADARNLTEEQVTNIAKGRIYSGIDAKKIGLVDEIGTLDNAIDEAKKLAKLNSINIVYYPKTKSGYELFFNTLLSNESESIIYKLFKKEYQAFDEINRIKQYAQPQTRIPFSINIY